MLSILLITLLLFLSAGNLIATADDGPGSVEVVTILIYADWYDKADNVSETMDQLSKDWHQNGAYVTKFDLSDEFTQIRTEEFAELMGLDEILEEYESHTGTLLIVDASSREVLEKFEPGFSHGEIDTYLTRELE